MSASARRRPASTASSFGCRQAGARTATHVGSPPQKEVELRPATPLGIAERGDFACEIAEGGPGGWRF